MILRRVCFQRATFAVVLVAFALWIIGATFILMTTNKSRPGGRSGDTAEGSYPTIRLLSPAEKRLTHLANVVSELRQEIGHRRRRVALGDDQLSRLKAQLVGGGTGPVVVAGDTTRHALKLNPKRRLMDVRSPFDPVSPAAQKTTPPRRGAADITKIAAPEGNLTDGLARGGMESKLLYGCREITAIPSRQKEFIGSGFTKEVHKALLGNKHVALKTPLRDGPDVVECTGYGMNVDECFRLANFKILKEIALLQQLQHPNIIKVLGFCLPNQIDTRHSSHATTMVTEYGEPISFLDLLKMSWEDRLRISLGVSRLLFYLSNSSIGSLSINDFKHSQFVRINGEIKLVDLDDVNDQPKPCRTAVDCALNGTTSTHYLSCTNGQCLNYWDRVNVFSAHRVFFTLLPYETPPALVDMMRELVNKTGEALIGSRQTYQDLQKVLQIYRSGEYLHMQNDEDSSEFYGASNAYKVVSDSDLPNEGDYWCASSLQMGSPSCVLSVFDESEAKSICDHDEQCTGFVMTSDKTWTGRTIIYLKKGWGHHSVRSPGNTLYLQQVM